MLYIDLWNKGKLNWLNIEIREISIWEEYFLLFLVKILVLWESPHWKQIWLVKKLAVTLSCYILTRETKEIELIDHWDKRNIYMRGLFISAFSCEKTSFMTKSSLKTNMISQESSCNSFLLYIESWETIKIELTGH